jgi:hypothetical protein
MALWRSAPWAVALTAIACLAAPAVAAADHGTPFLDDNLATYMGIAQANWGGPLPTCIADGVTVIPVHAVLYDDPDPDVAARADQPGCRLWLDRRQWRTMGRVEACTVVVHEWGHLLGFGHVRDPLNVMAAFPTRPPHHCAVLGRHATTAQPASRRPHPCVARARAAARSKHAARTPARRVQLRRIACVLPRATGRN